MSGQALIIAQGCIAACHWPRTGDGRKFPRRLETAIEFEFPPSLDNGPSAHGRRLLSEWNCRCGVHDLQNPSHLDRNLKETLGDTALQHDDLLQAYSEAIREASAGAKKQPESSIQNGTLGTNALELAWKHYYTTTLDRTMASPGGNARSICSAEESIEYYP